MTEPLIRGEEWRRIHDLDRAEYASLPSDDEVLAEARDGIERHRKSDLALRLVDATGQPLRGRSVRIVQTRHHMVFGNCAGSTFARVAANPAEAARAEHFLALFNGTHAKCYWDEKWHQPIETHQGQRELREFLAEVDWGCAYGLAVRGHPLVWTVEKAVPKWMRKYSYEQQLRFLEHHVRSLIASTGRRIRTWDLVNEMLWEPSLRHLPQRDWPHLEAIDEMVNYIEPATRWAREEDPDACYCLNDYGLESTFTEMKGVTAAQQRRRMVELIQALRAQGAAPDAVGTQAHAGKWFPMAVVTRTFADLAKAGVPIHVTEFWAEPHNHPSPEGRSPEQLEADKAAYIAAYYTVAFGTPQVEQINYWGHDTFFARGGWTTTPSYAALYDLIRRQWWTDVEAASDNDGLLRMRVFHGDHVVRWTAADGTPHSRPLRVEPGRSQEGMLVLA